MKTSRKFLRDCERARRHGLALVAVIVLFAVSLTLFGLWAKAAVRERQRMASEQFRLQAVQLAEAGVSRAIARRASDPQYEKETWSVSAESLGGTHAAAVRIQVAPAKDASIVRFKATAVYPVGATRHAKVTKHIDHPNESTIGEP